MVDGYQSTRHTVNLSPVNMSHHAVSWRQLFWYSLDCKAVARRGIPNTYKPKPNPYLNTNPNPKPSNPTSILCKDSRKDFTLHTVHSQLVTSV